MYPKEYHSEEERESKYIEFEGLMCILIDVKSVGSCFGRMNFWNHINFWLWYIIMMVNIEDQRKFGMDDAIGRGMGYLKAFADYR